MRTGLFTGAALVVVAVAAGQVLSKDDAARSPDEMKKAYERYGTPGKEHEILKRLEGDFETRMKVSPDPSKPEMKESSGRCTTKLVFGGLFLREEFEGQCPITGKSFQGLGHTGFDNAKKKYVSTWLDSLSSGIFVQEGTADPSGKTITFTGTCPDPITGKDKKARSILKIVDENKHTFEMFEVGADGKENRVMEITYNKTIGK